MITHVVLFRFRDKSDETLKKVKSMLEGLSGRVPSLRSMEAGVDVLRTERSFDLGLIARFDDLDGLEEYQRHPAHREVADFIAAIKESIVAVDYES